MLRRKIAALSLVLVTSQFVGAMLSPSQVLAQSPATAGDNPDNWPWMQVNPENVKKVQPGPAASTTPDVPLTDSTAKPTAAATPTQEVKPTEVEKKEQPKAAIATPKSEPKKEEKFDVYKLPGTLHEEHATAAGTGGGQAKPGRMLFGRIEELSSGTGAKFPLLRAQKASLDTRETQLKGAAQETVYSGSVVRSFPTNMEGTWGGTLRLMQIQIDPLSYQLDAAEAKQTADLARPGIDGKINFTFQNSPSGVTLEPSQIIFQSPMTESRMASLMKGANTMGMPGMGNMAAMPGMQQMMQQMMGSMPYTWALYFGTTQGVGVSGNSVQTQLLSNKIRELSPTVLEEQIVSQETNTNPTTGRTRHSYSESVVRFTQYGSSQKYVQAACVDYNSDKRFLRKMVFAGYVTKGAVQNVSPMGGQLGGATGASPMGGLEKLFAPGLNLSDPNSNPLKQLFGQ